MTEPVKKAMCVFQKDGKVLVSSGFDKVKNQKFYRFLGGHIEEGENEEVAIRREIQEELSSEVENLKFIESKESYFTYQGQECHEIVYLYSGDLLRKEIYESDVVHVTEPNHEFDAYW